MGLMMSKVTPFFVCNGIIINCNLNQRGKKIIFTVLCTKSTKNDDIVL